MTDTLEHSDFFKIVMQMQQNTVKERAFIVLRDKCNSCHATKTRLIIFTLGTMDSLHLDINTQVFIKRKMPKGKKNNLSEKEEIDLKIWLCSLY